MDPLVRLAANAVPNDRQFVLLAGAGLSKDAGQPTAWDILMETAQLLRASEGGDASQPIEDWFKGSAHIAESYPTIVAKLFPNPAEQQSFLQRILKVRAPGPAHKAIAELAARGVIRAVVTTNFDDLIERALREKGIDVQIVASDADFARATPLIHCKQFRVYKPHGTLGTGVLRNTPADVAELPAPIVGELKRVFDDHGLIVVGFAGADQGIMGALAQRRPNLFPVYWMHVGAELPASIAADVGENIVPLPISGARVAFEALLRIQDSLSRISSSGAQIDIAGAVSAANENRKDAVARFKSAMKSIGVAIERVSPRPDELNLQQNPAADGVFVKALEATVPAIVEFAKLAAAAAQNDALDACKAIREEIHQLDRFYTAPNAVTVREFVEFLQQEMLLIVVAELIENDRWATLGAMLDHLCFNSRLERESWKKLNPY